MLPCSLWPYYIGSMEEKEGMDAHIFRRWKLKCIIQKDVQNMVKTLQKLIQNLLKDVQKLF